MPKAIRNYMRGSSAEKDSPAYIVLSSPSTLKSLSKQSIEYNAEEA
jgi:hypothetical protein